MVLTESMNWRALAGALLLIGSTAQGVRAEAHGGIAALSLTASDGTMHTHTGVRLAISPAPGMPDHVVAMSAPVQARMGSLRTCFTAAMQRSPRVGGQTEFELEAKGHATKVRLTRDEIGDSALTSCMKRALQRAQLARLPRGARARIGVKLNNPLASRAAAAPRQVGAVRMLANGRAESEHGMLEGDIKVRLTGAAASVPTINRLQEDIATQVSGLLDCRRKAIRAERDEAFSIAIPLTLRAGALGHGAPRVSEQAPRAPACLTEWLGRLDTKRLADADLELAIVFKR